MTRRQQLIRQMRDALHHLQNPSFPDYNETLELSVAETTFEFSVVELDAEVVE